MGAKRTVRTRVTGLFDLTSVRLLIHSSEMFIADCQTHSRSYRISRLSRLCLIVFAQCVSLGVDASLCLYVLSIDRVSSDGATATSCSSVVQENKKYHHFKNPDHQETRQWVSVDGVLHTDVSLPYRSQKENWISP